MSVSFLFSFSFSFALTFFLTLLTNWAWKKIQSIHLYPCVREAPSLSLLLGNTRECSRSFRLADHSCTRGSRLLWLRGSSRRASINLTRLFLLKTRREQKKNHNTNTTSLPFRALIVIIYMKFHSRHVDFTEKIFFCFDQRLKSCTGILQLFLVYF